MEATVINQKISRKSIESARKKKKNKIQKTRTWEPELDGIDPEQLPGLGAHPGQSIERDAIRGGGSGEVGTRNFDASPPLHSPCLLSLSLSLFFSPTIYIPEAVEQRRKRRKTEGRNRGEKLGILEGARSCPGCYRAPATWRRRIFV